MGKMVKCEKCQAEFAALENVPVEIVPEPPPAAVPIVVENAEVEVIEPPAKAPVLAMRRPRQRVRLDERDDEDNEEERRPRRPRRQRINPYEAVKTPSLGLLVAGYAGAAIHVLLLIAGVVIQISVALSAPPSARSTQSAPVGLYVANVIFSILVIIIIFAWSSLVIRAANSLHSLQNYHMALAGCLIAMLPCNCGWIGGLPFGLWGLILLLNYDVKRTFD